MNPNIPKRSPFNHPELREYAFGDVFQSSDTKTIVVLVDYDPGKVLRIEPSVTVQITSSNHGTAPSDTINDIRQKLEQELELGERETPHDTMTETKKMTIDEFLLFISSFTKL